MAFFRTTVFTEAVDGYHTVRIPSLAVTHAGTLIAFAEGRSSRRDHANNDMICKRSFDGGRSWGDVSVIGHDGENCFLNPCVVVLRDSGRIMLMVTHYINGYHGDKTVPGNTEPNINRVYLTYSDDDGELWADLREITSMIKPPEHVTAVPVGPGHGIELNRGAHSGRIVMPFVHQIRKNKLVMDRKLTAAWSDNGGATWQWGGYPDDSGIEGTGAEVQIVELVDGTLLMNSRNAHGNHKRKTARSTDGAQTWSPLLDVPEQTEPECQGSLMRYSAVDDGGQRNILLFANPSSRKKRSNGTVYASYDEGDTWPVSRCVDIGGLYAYSCLGKLTNGAIGLLFENGEHDPYERIDFVSFGLEWLEEYAADR